MDGLSSPRRRAQRITTELLACDPASISFAHALSDAPPVINSSSTRQALELASKILVEKHRPVAFPTETVYGLGANALNPDAAARIFEAKGRPSDNPLIVHVSSLPMLEHLLPPNYRISSTYRKLIDAFWPGPLTLLFPSNPAVIPSIISAGQPTVAIRIPSHPIARALIATAGVPLAAPSANTSGRPSPTRAEHVLHDLDGKVDLIIDGGSCAVGLESTVVDGLNEDGILRILRPGGVTVEDIERVLGQDATEGGEPPKVLVHGRDFRDGKMEAAPTTPGMKYRHYAPKPPVILLLTGTPPAGTSREEIAPVINDILGSLRSRRVAGKTLRIGLMLQSDSHDLEALINRTIENIGSSAVVSRNLGPRDHLSSTAQRLFDNLLWMEEQDVDCILMEGVDEQREGLAIMNRMKKVAGQTRWVDISIST